MLCTETVMKSMILKEGLKNNHVSLLYILRIVLWWFSYKICFENDHT